MKDDPPLPEPAWWAEDRTTGKHGRRGIYRSQQFIERHGKGSEYDGLFTVDQIHARDAIWRERVNDAWLEGQADGRMTARERVDALRGALAELVRLDRLRKPYPSVSPWKEAWAAARKALEDSQ